MRERRTKEVHETVLADQTPSVPLVIPRQGRADTELQAKEVKVGDRRYIVCRNLVEAAQAAKTREAIVATLRAKLRQGDKSLVGNSAYRRYLKTPDENHFTIDEERIAEDVIYDGLYVLRTNTRLHPLQAMLRYRDLLVVEQVFRTEKSLLATPPTYHQTDEARRLCPIARIGSWRVPTEHRTVPHGGRLLLGYPECSVEFIGRGRGA